MRLRCKDVRVILLMYCSLHLEQTRSVGAVGRLHPGGQGAGVLREETEDQEGQIVVSLCLLRKTLIEEIASPVDCEALVRSMA